MPVTKLFIVGSLTIPSSWIALIIAFVVAYCAVRVRYGKSHAERLADAFFYVVIVWKLSVVITDFSSVIRSPLTIIYFHGGVFGFYLGLLFVIGKSIIDLKRKRLERTGLWALFSGTVTAQVVYQLWMVLLNEGEWIAQLMTVLLFTLFAVLFWMNNGKVGDWLWQLALLFIAVHVFTATFQPDGLSGTPLIITGITGVFFAVQARRMGYELEEQL